MSNLDLCLKIASYLVVLGGLGSLALTGEIPIPLLSFAFLSFFLSFFYPHPYPPPFATQKGEGEQGRLHPLHKKPTLVSPSRKREKKREIWDKLALLIFILYVLDFSMASSFLMATVHLLIFLQILKLFTLKEDKDYLYLYLLSFSQLLAASMLNINLSYFWSFLFFLVAITWALLLHHLKKEMGEGSFSLNPSFFLITSSIAILAFAITLTLFFIIPHVELGLSRKRIGKSVRLSGFSEMMDLGGLGPIKLDSTVVMRVMMPEQRNAKFFYWRGTAFDYFDGFSWHRTFSQKRLLLKDPVGNFLVHKLKGDGHLLRYEFFLEPIDSRVIFTVPKTVQIIGSFPYLLKDFLDAFYLPRLPLVPISYTVYSTAEDFFQRNPEPIFDRNIYLRMPAMAEDIERLVEQVTRGLNSSYEKVQAIENFLKKYYRYDLNVERDYRFRPIQDFLFNRKAGYCEHFATAMVLMLRSVEIPARLVTGFLQGEWNEFGKYYLICQKDAHSWVEAYLPSMGWITLDPTPPIRYEVLSSSPFLEYFYRYVDSLRLKWHRYILCYSLGDQIKLIHELKMQIYILEGYLLRSFLWIKEFFQELVGNKSLAIKQAISRGKPLITFSIFVPIIIVGFLVILWTLRSRQVCYHSFKVTSYQYRKRVKFYAQMLKILEKKGLVRTLGVTPLEFAQHIMKMKGDNFYEVMEVTSAYNRVRFGGEILSSMEKERIWKIVKDLKRK